MVAMIKTLMSLFGQGAEYDKLMPDVRLLLCSTPFLVKGHVLLRVRVGITRTYGAATCAATDDVTTIPEPMMPMRDLAQLWCRSCRQGYLLQQALARTLLITFGEHGDQVIETVRKNGEEKWCWLDPDLVLRR